MPQPLRHVHQYVAELTRETTRGWSAFWFEPADPTTLGLIRLLTGLMLVYTHAVWWLDLDAFFGPDGWLSDPALRELESGRFVFSYLWYVPTGWLRVTHAAAMLALVLFAVGLWSRVTSVLSFVIVVSYAHRVPQALFGLDQINAMLTLYLCLGPSGAVFSLDRLVRRRWPARPGDAVDTSASASSDPQPSIAANVAIRLIQVHLCVIYLFAALSKLQGEAWWDGTAIWLAAANHEYQSGDLTWLAHAPLLVNLLTHLALFWELSFCVLVWPRVTRPLVLLGAVLLHLGIGLFMGMLTFGLIMLVGCLAFVPPRLVRELLGRRPAAGAFT